MKHWVVILILLMSVVSGSERLYNETGALPSTRADWERVGVDALSDADLLACPQLRHRLSCGIFQFGSLRTSEFPKLPTASPTIPMSAVKNQGCDHGFCTAFAICASAEAVTGKIFSEAELVLRLKTDGGDDRACDGSYLSLYPPLLRYGLILNENFPCYNAFDTYITIRKNQSELTKHNPNFPLLKPNERFCHDGADYKNAILSFQSWCEKGKRTMPQKMSPSWGPVVLSADNYTGDLVKKYPHFKDSFKERPNTGFVVTALDAGSYYETSFKMKQVAVFEPNHLSGDPLYKLKFSLLQRTPIAISIKTFAKYKLDADGKRVVEKTWLGTAPQLDNNYKIDVPPSEYERYGGHAICLCGYDDTKGAFRFKNSWGPGWGDKGYAWLSYDYVAQHAFMDDAFSIEIDRR